MDHIIRRRQIEPRAARLEADQEQIAIARLKGLDALRPLLRRRGAVEILIAHPTRIERLAHLIEVAQELAEHQRLVPVAQKLVRQR